MFDGEGIMLQQTHYLTILDIMLNYYLYRFAISFYVGD